MKKLIRKILAGNNEISEYSKIRINDTIREKVYLETAEGMMDISEHHWILCIEPVVFGVWMEGANETVVTEKKNLFNIYFCDSGNNNIKKNALGIIDVVLTDSIKEKDGTLYLFNVKSSNIHHLNAIKRWVLFHRYYKKNELTFSKFKSFVAAYSYPRQVRIVSFRQQDYYNIFPMDLLGDIDNCNRYVFGLRHTNISLKGIIETGKLVVSELSFKHKDVIFELGKHHSGTPPSLEALPFGTVVSKNFCFEIPDLADSYKEIKIIKTINLGSHMLLWGETQYASTFVKANEHLYLMHFLQYLHQKNKGVEYALV